MTEKYQIQLGLTQWTNWLNLSAENVMMFAKHLMIVLIVKRMNKDHISSDHVRYTMVWHSVKPE